MDSEEMSNKEMNCEEINSTEVVEAIERMRKDNTPFTQSDMLECVVSAKYLAPVLIDPPPKKTDGNNGVVTISDKTSVKFHMIENKQNQCFFLAFTSFEELGKWRKDPLMQTVVITFDDLASMLAQAETQDRTCGFVIDPFGINMIFTKEQTAKLYQQKQIHEKGVVRQRFKEGTQVYIGEPSEYPTDLVDALKKYLETQDEVKKAYLQLLINEEEESYLIALDFEGEQQEIFEKVASVAKPFLKGMFLDLVETTSNLGENVAKQVTPFFSK